jgi:WD40 repeat protein
LMFRINSQIAAQTPQPSPTFNYIKPILELNGPAGKVSQLEFSPDEKFITSAACIKETLYTCINSEVALWDLETGQKRVSYGLDGKIIRLGFMPSTQTLAIINDGRLYFWETGKQPKPIETDYKVVNNFAYSSDGKYLALVNCAQEPSRITLLATVNLQTIAEKNGVSCAASLAVNNAGQVAYMESLTSIWLWDYRVEPTNQLRRLTNLETPALKQELLSYVRFNDEGTAIAFYGSNRYDTFIVRLYDVKTGEYYVTGTGHPFIIIDQNSANFTQNGELVSFDGIGLVFKWNLQTKIETFIDYHYDYTKLAPGLFTTRQHAALSSDLRTIAISGCIKPYDTQSKTLCINSKIWLLAFLPN